MSIHRALILVTFSFFLSSTPLVAQATLGIQLDPNATVTTVEHGSAGEKAGLKVGDIIIGLNNHALSQGTPEITTTLQKTRGGSLLPISIRRDGDVMTFLAFPPASAGAENSPNAGVVALPGHYTCLTFTFQGGGLNGLAEAPSSIGTGIDLMSGGQYRSLGRTGTFHSDTKADRLVFETGPLSDAIAHLQRDTNGKPKIAFLQNENRRGINGHEIDHGPTACYLK